MHALVLVMSRFLVVLGTTSHSGKSTLVAALCRILSDRGFKVAPFKSQNMSLNSWVTQNGSEIGIAQAVQAWAARTEPTEFMNPILLKPKGDRTSQVIVLGRPVADKSAEEYYREIEGLKEVVDRSIKELEKNYDYIVVEGAGGAAEINLFDRDIANIYVARYLHAPIILVGDIERGGVFASLFGTVQLLPEDITASRQGPGYQQIPGRSCHFGLWPEDAGRAHRRERAGRHALSRSGHTLRGLCLFRRQEGGGRRASRSRLP